MAKQNLPVSKTANKGQFPAGKSGNPRGRPKGSKNKATILREAMQNKADKMLSAQVPKVLKVVIEAAIAGDMQAAKMVLDRAVPVQKAAEGDSGASNNAVQITIQNLTSPHEEDRGVTINGETVQ